MDGLPKIIGFAGAINAGKDTCTKFLLDYLTEKGIPHQHLKFADKLKQVISIMTDVPLEEIYTHEGKAKFIPELNQTVGKLHQTIGDLMKQINPNIWVYPVSRKFNSNLFIVISDVRFLSEANAIKEAGGIIIKIERNDKHDPLTSTGRDPKHNSETSLNHYEGFSTILHNDGTLEELKLKLFKHLNLE